MILEIKELYDKYIDVLNENLVEHDPMEVAGILVTQGLTLYKTFLTDEDFNMIVDQISNSRDTVKTFGPDGKLQ